LLAEPTSPPTPPRRSRYLIIAPPH